MQNVNVYVYQGNDRYNLTQLIYNNATASIGAPYSVPVDDGFVVFVSPYTTAGGTV